MYRPLSPNEYAVVSQVIYQERGLDGGLAESMFMAYKARAMALDEPEFAIFQESEVERKARLAEKQQDKVVDLPAKAEMEPMEFLKKLESFSKTDEPNKDPKNCYEWFYGNEAALSVRHKRLRVKFFNSPKYRKQVLRSYFENGVIQESQLGDTRLIGELIGEFHRKYPGTRQGIISNYEIYFGDPSGFSYRTALERKAFHEDPKYRREFLKLRKLPEHWGVEEIKIYFESDALGAGILTKEQLEQWDDR
jgi:hypothetical protein